MEILVNAKKAYNHWIVCPDCQGRGKKSRKISKKARLKYEQAVLQFEKGSEEGLRPKRPAGHLFLCSNCSGSGLIASEKPAFVDANNYPNVAIIGGGIGGVALAVACLHRGIPFTLFERDEHFNARSQGYGLTLQQASKAMSGLGILSLKEGVISTKHVVHTTDGKIIGTWGARKWMASKDYKSDKKSNVHISRQFLRLALMEQFGANKTVKWEHHLVDMKEVEGDGITLSFEVKGKLYKSKADLVVGADGIRSSVRKLLLGNENTPLKYLGCIVILGICSLSALQNLEHELLDSETVFQTANGNERIYVMPFTSDSVMWQLSFPMTEQDAKILSEQGSKALKEEACQRTKWHNPIPQIIKATLESDITGYPVYDREMLNSELLKNIGSSTLIGDAAHPMSPFKGQGANQALLDALNLARSISRNCGSFSKWKTNGLRETILNEFESKMIERTAPKVKDSAIAAQFLHSENILHEKDAPRGRGECISKDLGKF